MQRRYTGKPAPAKKTYHPGLSARRIAYDILRDVTLSGAYASLSLNKRLSASRLTGADRRLASALVYDTLENLIYIDFMLDHFLDKKDTDPALRDLLRLGACQILLYDRIPDSAAVNETVNLCAPLGLEGFKPAVNGVLRNLIRGRTDVILPDAQKEPASFLSVSYSLPLWLVSRLIDDYGVDEAHAIAGHRDRMGGATVRPNMLRLNDTQFESLLSRKSWGWRKLATPHAYHVAAETGLGTDRDHVNGLFSIQGEGSMLAAMAVGARNGWQILDCCSAPGGKAAYLSESMGGSGRVHAWDIHPHRVDLILAMQKRLRLDNIRPMLRDALVYRQDLDGVFDAVLIDAPCSGFGVMLSKPDVKYRHGPDDMEALVQTQAKLLDVCSRYVKRGGVLVYATCTFLKDENERQINAFLESHPRFSMDPLPDSIPAAFRERAGTHGLQLFAHRDGVEGFFIARMKKTNASR